ncbi:hypothetical protein MUK42_16488 [Musa troglodytarum]|uniref:Uncharacterized protein n=1 Tax=Musa troglodytarum TaxID=320322 RepID=A0A9E7KTS3_9LILI|nr:hypothetical protein MUK42_16488 [Musa troglodytarum]
MLAVSGVQKELAECNRDKAISGPVSTPYVRGAVDGDLVLSGSTIGMQWLMADVIGVHHGFLIYSAGSRHQKGTHLGPAS